MNWGAAATFGVAASIVGYGFFNPTPSETTRVSFPDGLCGRASGRHFLVAYASEFGTTGEVAESIAATLCTTGVRVTTKRIGGITDLDQYDAVFVGAAIQFDTWMSEARRFVAVNETVLADLPVAYFFTCLTLADSSGEAQEKAAGYATKLRRLSDAVEPVSVGQFGGVLDYGRMSWPSVLASKLVYKVVGVVEGDYRRWADIERWTYEAFEEIRPRLSPG